MLNLEGGRARRGSVFALLLATLASTSKDAVAWNDFGHMQVAALAYRTLDARSRQRVGELLKLNPSYGYWTVGSKPGHERQSAFIRAATWADAIKADPAYTDDKSTDPNAMQIVGYSDRSRHGYWHYINVPFSPDDTALQPAPTPNAVTMIDSLRATLASNDASDEVKSYALVWLLHLVGDIHQPLHCVARFDAEHPTGDHGGNGVEITGAIHAAPCDDPRYCPYAPPTRLHAYVDSVLGSSYALEPVLTAIAELPAPNSKQVAIVDAARWAEEGLALAKSDVYVGPIGVGKGPFRVDSAYEMKIAALARQRVALAGVRLGKLLRDAL